ncbi:MAG: rRNA-processing protein bfr2 [Piccolia ochrophora]|nr:MAG: rRNA-processing protein bfr2 [Piccolia ochrophora]
MKRQKTLAEQIADLEDPTPKDFDPEAIDEDPGSNNDSDAASDSKADNVREHYIEVGEGKLRKPEEVPLGPQYSGSRISRDDLDGLDSEDDPFAPRGSASESASDSEPANGSDRFTNGMEVDHGGEDENDGDLKEDDLGSHQRSTATSSANQQISASSVRRASTNLNGGGKRPADDAEPFAWGENQVADVQRPVKKQNGVVHDEEDDFAGFGSETSGKGSESFASDVASSEEDEDMEDMPTRERNDRSFQRDALRNMMQEEQKTVAATISKAAKSDAEKGVAVKQQRKTFDTLLNTRIQLQKAIVAMNSLPLAKQPSDSAADSDPTSAYASATDAALRLFNTISDLRDSLPTSPSAAPRKRKCQTVTPNTPISDLWSELESLEATHDPSRLPTLEKWATKTRAPQTLSALSTGRLNPSAAIHHASLTATLQSQLADRARLLARARTPRSCAPLQAAATASSLQTPPEPATTAPEPIYDDADFYQLLLRSLLEQRASSASSFANHTQTTTADGLTDALASREAKVRKKVDTRASKGRKMRFTVQEKLQNFMAPEDRGTWGARQREELWRGLVGAVRGGLEEGVDEGVDGGEEEGEVALRLFRS